MRAIPRRLVCSSSLLLFASAAPAQDRPVSYLTVWGGSGGTSFSRSCPAGSVLTGIRARVGVTVDAIGLRCRPVAADGTLGGEVSVGTLAGGSGGNFIQKSCPSGSVLFRQRISRSLSITSLKLECADWSASRRSFGSYVGDVGILNPVWPVALVAWEDCPYVQPAHGIRGRAGMVIDAFGLVCNEP